MSGCDQFTISFLTRKKAESSGPKGAVVRNLPAIEGDARDVGSIPGLGR